MKSGKLLWNARDKMVSVMSLNFGKFFEIAVDDDDSSFVYSIKENICLLYKKFLVEMPAINHRKNRLNSVVDVEYSVGNNGICGLVCVFFDFLCSFGRSIYAQHWFL